MIFRLLPTYIKIYWCTYGKHLEGYFIAHRQFKHAELWAFFFVIFSFFFSFLARVEGINGFVSCQLLGEQRKCAFDSSMLHAAACNNSSSIAITLSFLCRTAGIMGTETRRGTPLTDRWYADVQHGFQILSPLSTPERLETSDQVRSPTGWRNLRVSGFHPSA